MFTSNIDWSDTEWTMSPKCKKGQLSAHVSVCCCCWPDYLPEQKHGAPGHSWPTEVQTVKEGNDTWLYRVLTQGQDMQPVLRGKQTIKSPQNAGENTPLHSHEKVSATSDWESKVCVWMWESVLMCVQTVDGAGTGDREKRGMRHCIKLWTSVPHRNHKADAEEMQRVTSPSSFLTHT